MGRRVGYIYWEIRKGLIEGMRVGFGWSSFRMFYIFLTSLLFRRYPKARVWPPLPSGSTALSGEDEFVSQLPSAEVQRHLLDLYFAHIHPSFPIIHKQTFLDSYKAGYASFSLFVGHGTKLLIELVTTRLYLIPTRQITNLPSIVGPNVCQPSSSSPCMLLHRGMMIARLQLI